MTFSTHKNNKHGIRNKIEESKVVESKEQKEAQYNKQNDRKF